MTRDVIGVALGGVGGFNSHDAGVLKAMHDCDLKPDVITCTSGAIYWVYEYLTDPDGIPRKVQIQADQVRGSNVALVGITGIPGICIPAYPEYVTRWFKPPRARVSLREFWNRLLPAQMYRPARTKADFAAIADAFNKETSVAIVFNAYSISEGRETLFCNQPAFDFLDVSPTTDDHHVTGRVSPTQYRLIDAAAVESALWLVLYGFGHRYHGQVVIDGAYHRQLIMAELTRCDTVYAVKPQSDGWHAAPPANYFEVQDFNMEMWFNSAYAAEYAALKKDSPEIRIERITMNRPLGYFNYLVEKTKNYTAGYEKAKEIFEKDHAALGRAS